MTSLVKTLRSLGNRLQAGASICQLYGEPVEQGGRTIVPVARMRYGFGAGGGSKHGGGGAGIDFRPVGLIEISDDGTRFVPLHRPLPLILALLGGLLLGYNLGRRAGPRDRGR
ncbi:MAG TPA: spore germination protein GerW family protein [Stellaceae bacterium]|nr:spore germination protein GerW family protein [Stellaceae bacterium]